MLQLFNKDKLKLAGLVNYKDLVIESILESGDKTLSFSYPKTSKYYFDIEEEGYIRTKENEYVIKEKNVQDDYTDFKCNLNLEDLEGKPWERFDSTEQPIDNALALALAGTGWIVGNCSLKKKRTVRVSDCSSLEVIKNIRKVYRCDLVFNTLTKTIDVYEHLGEDKGTYFIDSLNLKSLGIQGNSYDYYTRIIPIGKDNLRISSINNGKEYVENYQYSKKVKTIYWKDDRYTIIENLKEDAEAKLNEISKPYRSYAGDIINLAKLNAKYKNILDYKLGDTIYLISKDNKFRDKQRIVKIIEHPKEHELDSVELANTKLSFEETQTQFQEATDTVNNITTDNGTVDGTTIDEIETKQIKDFDSQVIRASNIEAINMKVTNLEAYNVTITGQLTAVQATIGTLTANVATIDKLTVTHSAYISDLQASKASITQLEAVNATIHVLESNVGNIETLLNGNLSSENIQAGGITSDKLTITNGFITNAMIASLDVAKVNAGDLSTNKFRITSDSGNMLIADNTIQIRDNSRVRVQIGKDASNDYNMYVWDASGNLMFDATGLKSGGIKDKIIRNDMISDNANIDGGKLNINSVITSINNGATTIKGSKVQIDGTNQTLDVSFNSLKTEVQGIQIGGRNLLLDSKRERAASPREYLSINITDIAIKNLNKKVTFSGLVRTNGKDGIVRIYSLGKYLINCDTSVECTTSEFVRFEITGQFTYNPNGDNGDNCNLSFYGTYDSGVFPVVKEVKVELGTKATDYTEAPEDIEGEINNIKEITTSQSTTISVMQGQISTAINNTQIVKDGQTILLKDDYNRTVSTVDSMKSTIGQHTTDINQHTGQITGVETRVNTVERDLSSITARVSSTETSINSLQIGGRNYVTKEKRLNNWIGLNNPQIINPNNEADCPNGVWLTGAEGEQSTARLEHIIDSNGWWTISFYLRGIQGAEWGFYLDIADNNSQYIKTTSDNQWRKIVLSAEVNNYSPDVYHFIDFNNLAWQHFLIKDLKVEKGNKATDWTPAPKDIQDEVTTTNNKVSAIEVNLNSITSRVSSVETTTIDLGNASSQNLLENADFLIIDNNFPKNWAGNQYTEIIWDNTTTFEGCNVVKINVSGLPGDRWTALQSPYIECREGSKFVGSAYIVIIKSTIDRGIGLEVEYFNSQGDRISTSGMLFGDTLIDGQWQRISVSGVAPSGTVKARLRVHATRNGHFNVAKPMLQLGDTLTGWVRGFDTNGIETRLSYAEQKITPSSIISTVSTQFYSKGETDSKYAAQSQIIQLSNQIETKVDVNGVKSTIQQNPGDVMIGFNGINDRVNINSFEMAFKNKDGKRTYAIVKGQANLYNPYDATLLGSVVPRSTLGGSYLTNGISTVVSANGFFYSISKASDWTGDGNVTYNPIEYFILNFKDVNATPQGKAGAHFHTILFPEAGIDMHNKMIDNVSLLYTDTLATDKWRRRDNGGNILSYNQSWGHLDLHIDMECNHKTLKNAVIQAAYSLAATSPGTSVGADTASVETMLLQEDFSKYDELNHAVVVDMNEAIKSVYAKNKNLETGNEQLKQENKNLNDELSMTKSVIDELLMNAI